MTTTSKTAKNLQELTGVRRSRNGRLAIDWLSRRQKPRWRMVALDGQLYDRDRLRDRLQDRLRQRGTNTAATVVNRAAVTVVPSTSRPLTPQEVAEVMNANPWRLFRRAAR